MGGINLIRAHSVVIFYDLGGKHLAPKAEVTGSNPVGCANLFKYLDLIITDRFLSILDNFRIIRSRAVLGRFGKCTTAVGFAFLCLVKMLKYSSDTPSIEAVKSYTQLFC